MKDCNPYEVIASLSVTVAKLQHALEVEKSQHEHMANLYVDQEDLYVHTHNLALRHAAILTEIRSTLTARQQDGCNTIPIAWITEILENPTNPQQLEF